MSGPVSSEPAGDGDAPPEALRPPYAKYPVLLATVIILGVLIVIAFVAVIAGVILRVSAPRAPAPTDVPAQAAPHILPLQAGAEVRELDLDGGRLALHVVHADGRQEIVVIDVGSGAVAARFGWPGEEPK